VAPLPEDPRPSSFGIAVVFDWALTVQLAVQALWGQLGAFGLRGGVGQTSVRLVGALLFAALGDALRRGRDIARYLQAIAGAAVSAGGVFVLVRLASGRGTAGSAFPAAIMVTFAPWMTWRLLIPRTAAFFRDVGAVRRRTDARWLVLVLAQSVVWGVAVALSETR
jgi:hypothetical protein